MSETNRNDSINSMDNSNNTFIESKQMRSIANTNIIRVNANEVIKLDQKRSTSASNGNNNISPDSDQKRSIAVRDNDNDVLMELKYLSALVTKMDIRINNLCTDLTGKSYENKKIGF